jgi:shikimate kinase
MWITKGTFHCISHIISIFEIPVSSGLKSSSSIYFFEVAICSPEEYLGIGHPALNPDHKT